MRSDFPTKFGNTPYKVNKCVVSNDEGLIIPASELNGMRRRAVEELMKCEKVSVSCVEYDESSAQSEKSVGEKYYTARFLDPESIPDRHPFKRIFIPDAAPLIGFLMFGNLLTVSGVTDRISKAAQNELMNIVTIFLGVSVGATASAEKFLAFDTLKIIALGLCAFMLSTVGGLLFSMSII